jgi:hypothetical protein
VITILGTAGADMQEPMVLPIRPHEDTGRMNVTTTPSLENVETEEVQCNLKRRDDDETLGPHRDQEPMSTGLGTVAAEPPLAFLTLSDRRVTMESRRMSTGTLLNREVKDKTNHNTLSKTVASLLESQLIIDNDTMEWRNSMLRELEDQQKLNDLNNQQHFVHPLHCAEDPKAQRRRLSIMYDDDVSVLSTDSAQSTWSMASAYQSWFGTKSQSRQRLLTPKLSSKRFNYPKQMHPSGRRFIDLTVNGGQDDFDDYDVYENDAEDSHENEDECSETASMYSIPVQNSKRRSRGSKDRQSMARKFLDLTDGTDYDQHPDTFGNSKLFAFSWMGRPKGGSNNAIPQNDLSPWNANMSTPIISENVCSTHDGDDDDDGDDNEQHSISVCSDESDQIRAMAAWEKADAALIESVHDVARNLERMLNEQGLESPFWSAQEIIPQFKGLHTKIKENMDRLTSKPEPPPQLQTPSPTIKARAGKSTNGANTGRPSVRRLSSEFSDITSCRTLLPQHDPIGGYDDLGMRTLERDERAYLKTFLYDCRSDGSCTLPLVLAYGLEKRLTNDTIDVALDILENLTSPLRPCREPALKEVDKEGDDDLMKDNTSNRSLEGIKSKSALEESGTSNGYLHFSATSLQPILEVEKKTETNEHTSLETP